MPIRKVDYLLMGIAAGVIAGIILVYIVGITYIEVIRVSAAIKSAFK